MSNTYKDILKLEDIEKLFRYDPITGVITRRTPRKGSVSITLNKSSGKHPRIDFCVNSKKYQIAAHSIAWILHYHEWPNGSILHRDLNPFNLSILNLVDVEHIVIKKIEGYLKNIESNCKPIPHKTDKYKFKVCYYLDGVKRKAIFDGFEAAKKYCDELVKQFHIKLRKFGVII